MNKRIIPLLEKQVLHIDSLTLGVGKTNPNLLLNLMKKLWRLRFRYQIQAILFKG